jgi:hypothetical protein
MRLPFTDGWNSAAHLLLGMASLYFWIIVPVFALYQFQRDQVQNRYIDLLEFFIGWSIVAAAIDFPNNRNEDGLVYG